MPPLDFANGLPDIPEEDYQGWSNQQWLSGAQQQIQDTVKNALTAPQQPVSQQDSSDDWLTGAQSTISQIASKALSGATPTSSAPQPGTGNPLVDYARQQATQNGLDPDVFQRQIQAESGFDPNAKSPAGAIGIAQFMPDTAKNLGIDPTNPQDALAGAAKLMGQYSKQYGGDMSKALAAYNAGPNGDFNNPETKAYVAKVLGGNNSDATAATSQAVAAGADPVNLAWAKQQLGKQEYINYCEQFVENASGANGQYASAINAWNSRPQQQQTDLSQIRPGDTVYFSANDSNGGDGHAGIYAGNGQFISATDNGVQQYDLGAWQKMTGQQLLGYIRTPGDAAAPSPASSPSMAQDAASNAANGLNAQSNASPGDWLGNALGRIMSTVTNALGGGPGSPTPPNNGNQQQGQQDDSGATNPNNIVFGGPPDNTANVLKPLPGEDIQAPADESGGILKPLTQGQTQQDSSDPWQNLGSTIANAIKNAIGSVVPGARIPKSPLEAIQDAGAQAGLPPAPDFSGQQSLQDYASKMADSASHGNYATPFGLFNPQFAPPNPEQDESAPGSLTAPEDNGARQAAASSDPALGLTPGSMDGSAAATNTGSKLASLEAMYKRQNSQTSTTGDSLGLWLQRNLADKNAAANIVSGNALDGVNADAAAGNLLPQEAGAIRDSVNAEAHLANYAGAPQAAAQAVDQVFRPIYDSLQGHSYLGTDGQQHPLSEALDSVAKLSTDSDRLANGPRMASAGINNQGDISSTMSDLKSRMSPEDWQLVQQANAQRQQILNDTRQAMVDGGLLSQEQANALKQQYPNYNPVRVSEYFQGQLRGGKGLDQSDNLLRALTDTGSPMDTQPAMQSAMQSVYNTDLAIRRNQIGSSIIQAAKLDPDMAGRIRLVAADDPAKAALVQKVEGIQRTGFMQAVAQGKEPANVLEAPSEANTITLFNNGQREVWQVPKVLADVANGLTEPQANAAMKFLGYLNAPIRIGSTIMSPTFVLSRAVWNAAYGWVRSGQTPIEQAAGMLHAIKKDDLYQAYIAAGGGMGRADVGATQAFTGKDIITSGQKLEQMVQRSGGLIVRDRGKVNTGATIAQLFSPRNGPIGRANEVINMGPRLAEYQRQLKSGATDAEAALAGRRVVTDFSRGGKWTSEMSQPVLFLNDHVRGILDVGRTLRDDPASRIRLAVLTSAAVGAYAWNRQFGNQINDVPQYVRDGSLVFMLPGSQPGALRYVAMPLRNLAAPKMAVDAFLDHLTQSGHQEDVAQVVKDMAGSFSPVPGNVLTAVMGNVPQTALEEVSNKDFFRNQDIVPQSMTDRSVPSPLQYTRSTSLVAKQLASDLARVPGLPKEFSSPKRVDYAIQQLTGTGGRLATQAISTAEGQPADTAPVVGGLSNGVVKTAGGQLQQDAYDRMGSSLDKTMRDNTDMYTLYATANAPLAKPPSTVRGVPLQPEERAQYEQARMVALRSIIDPSFETTLQDMPLQARQAALRKIVAAADKLATADVLGSMSSSDMSKRIVDQYNTKYGGPADQASQDEPWLHQLPAYTSK